MDSPDYIDYIKPGHLIIVTRCNPSLSSKTAHCDLLKHIKLFPSHSTVAKQVTQECELIESCQQFQ